MLKKCFHGVCDYLRFIMMIHWKGRGIPTRTETYTIDSRYLEVQGTLWNTSRYPYLDISDMQNWGKYKSTITFQKWICNLTPEVRDRLKMFLKREISSLFHSILLLLLDFHMKTGTRFSLRDKRLFEISKVEITRVDCICKLELHHN